MLQVNPPNGNTLKDSFYKERLIKSSANSMYNTFNKSSQPQDRDSDDELPENITKISIEEEALIMKDHLKNFGKTSSGSSYAFLTFDCTHKMLKSINVMIELFRKSDHISFCKKSIFPTTNSNPLNTCQVLIFWSKSLLHIMN